MSFKWLHSASGPLRQIYFEAIDLMVNAIDQCFNQPNFGTYAKMESLLKPVYTGDFCRSNSVQLDAIFVAPKLLSCNFIAILV